MKSRIDQKRNKRELIRKRIRRKISGTASCPRLTVFHSLKHLFAQAVDDEKGFVLVAASSQEKEGKALKKMGEKAKFVGAKIAERLKEKKLEAVVFDRNGRPYHGNIRLLAESAREKGVRF